MPIAVRLVGEPSRREAIPWRIIPVMSLLPLFSTSLIAQAAADGGPVQEIAPAPEPPAWVGDGVPDTVWRFALAVALDRHEAIGGIGAEEGEPGGG